MLNERDLALAVDIVAAANQVQQFVEGHDLESFRGDPKTSSAVLLQMLIIGEAAKGLTAQFRSEHSELPWSEIIRMHDKLIHHYRRTDLELVWETAERDIPEVLRVLAPLAVQSEEG